MSFWKLSCSEEEVKRREIKSTAMYITCVTGLSITPSTSIFRLQTFLTEEVFNSGCVVYVPAKKHKAPRLYSGVISVIFYNARRHMHHQLLSCKKYKLPKKKEKNTKKHLWKEVKNSAISTFANRKMCEQ